MPEEAIANPTLLAVLPYIEDCLSLDAIFGHSNWDLQFTQTFKEAKTGLNAFSFQAVICGSCLSDGHCWKELLREIRRMADPPPLIVADWKADEILWAEVLNLGGRDLIAKPFDAQEGFHVVIVACAISESEKLRARPRKRIGICGRSQCAGKPCTRGAQRQRKIIRNDMEMEMTRQVNSPKEMGRADVAAAAAIEPGSVTPESGAFHPPQYG
jgi:DNA-binding response OmpR family regulator